MKYIISIAWFVIVATVSSAQDMSIRDIFKQMPDSIVPYLSQNNKLDMVDFIDSNMKSEVNNDFNGISKLVALEPDYMMLELSPACLLEMKLLPYYFDGANKMIVCVVFTYGDKIKDSKVRFYTSQWQLLDDVDNPLTVENIGKYFDMNPNDSLCRSGVKDCLCVMAKLSPTDNTMHISMSLPISVSEEAITTQPLDLSTTLKWDGKSFK